VPKRLRIVGWRVQPVVMVDDGEHLTPVPVDAQTILAAQWEAFKNGGDSEALDALRQQVEGPTVLPEAAEKA
jgi:hypothetical protein